MTRRAAALLLSAVLVVVSACTTTRTGAPASTPTTTTKTATKTATTTPPAPTAAKDGADVAACRDAVCEVRLTGRTVLSVAPATGITEVAVESIVGDALTAAITLSRNQFSFDCQGDDACDISIVGTTPPVAFVTAHPGARARINSVVLSVPSAADGVAILQLSR